MLHIGQVSPVVIRGSTRGIICWGR